MLWIAAAVIVAAVLWLGWEVHRAPTCTCGQPDCGGGCLKRD